MARLILSAISEDVLASPGNRKANLIVVSVMGLDGAPLTGLQSADFVVKPVLVAPGGGKMTTMIRAHESDFPGVYLIEVIPDKDVSWRKGTYVFAVGVVKGFDKGQNLASVLMD